MKDLDRIEGKKRGVGESLSAQQRLASLPRLKLSSEKQGASVMKEETRVMEDVREERGKGCGRQ